MADGSSPAAPNELQQALLQYAATPGKYSVRLRQPSTLFAGITEVLQLAAMRHPADDRHAAELVEAARFFVQTALLHPEADHHAVLGLADGASANVAKERYRLLMRLLHPDFASAQVGWPTDAAARVNRAYDYVSSGGAAPPAVAPPSEVVSSARPQRAVPARPAVTEPVWILPKRRLKHAFLVLGFVGLCLMVLVLSIDRQGPVHLVQKPPPPTQRVVDLGSRPEVSVASSIGTTIGDLLADFTGSSALQLSKELTSTPAPRAPAIQHKPAPAPVATSSPPAIKVTRSEAPSVEDPLPQSASAATSSAVAQRDLTPDLPPPSPAAQVATPVAVAESPRSVAVAAAARSSPPPPPVDAPPPLRPGLTLAEVQPLLAALLQHMESGRGERMLSLLEPDARMRPSAQAFSLQYDGVVDGARVRLSQVQFKAEPSDGKLVVKGQMRVLLRDSPEGSAGRKFVVQAEFANRNGTVVLTALSGGPVN